MASPRSSSDILYPSSSKETLLGNDNFLCHSTWPKRLMTGSPTGRALDEDPTRPKILMTKSRIETKSVSIRSTPCPYLPHTDGRYLTSPLHLLIVSYRHFMISCTIFARRVGLLYNLCPEGQPLVQSSPGGSASCTTDRPSNDCFTACRYMSWSGSLSDRSPVVARQPDRM